MDVAAGSNQKGMEEQVMAPEIQNRNSEGECVNNGLLKMLCQERDLFVISDVLLQP